MARKPRTSLIFASLWRLRWLLLGSARGSLRGDRAPVELLRFRRQPAGVHELGERVGRRRRHAGESERHLRPGQQQKAALGDVQGVRPHTARDVDGDLDVAF